MLKQEPLLLVTLKEFFPRDFSRKVAVNMVSCSELKDEDCEEDVQADVQEASAPSTDDKFLAVLEVLPEHMSWKQIFHLPKKMCEQVVIALHHAKLYADKVKLVKEPAPVQCATCNIMVSFTDENLLLGSKPHNRSLFVTGYIKGQKVKHILVYGGSVMQSPRKESRKGTRKGELGRTGDARAIRTGRHDRALQAVAILQSSLRDFEKGKRFDSSNQ